MFKINIILLFILFVYGNKSIGATSIRNENFDDDINKIDICMNDKCEIINKNNISYSADVRAQRSKIIEKLDMINNKLDIIIKFKGMNKTDKEFKEELKTGMFILLKIFGIIIGIIIGIVFIIIIL